MQTCVQEELKSCMSFYIASVPPERKSTQFYVLECAFEISKCGAEMGLCS